jgi:mannan endo-1,4-beta-mannosidase
MRPSLRHVTPLVTVALAGALGLLACSNAVEDGEGRTAPEAPAPVPTAPTTTATTTANADGGPIMSAPDGGATSPPPADASTGQDAAPDAASASSGAAAVRSYLAGLAKGTSQRVLSGQHADIWTSDLSSATQPMDVVDPLTTQTGKAPAILGLVLNYATDSYAYTVSVTNTLAGAQWAKGGMVMLSLYDNDPTFSFNKSGAPTGKPIPGSAFHSLTDRSSAAYKQWHEQLDTYAAALHTLTDSGNVILFRPFIELNGNWNWYGAEDTTDFIAVWKDMHDYLMTTKGLTNVLWIYNVNAQVGKYTDYYPGTEYVDIYADGDKIVAGVNDGGMYAALLATGKPLIFPEVGLGSNAPPDDTVDDTAIIDDIRGSLPGVVGFLAFNGGWALCNQKNASALMHDSWVVNAGEIPTR